MKSSLLGWGACALGLFLFTASHVQGADHKVRAVCTVSMVADLVRHVGGDRVEVAALMGPGVDPHLYKATASDVRRLSGADVIFYSGLLLEGKMEDLFARMAKRNKLVFAVTASVPRDELLRPAEFEGHPDPHVWFDLRLWSKCIDTIVQGLSAADPRGRAHYEKRAAEYRQRLEALHRWVGEKVVEVPEAQRILVTSHDAYNYFGRAYGFQVVGLQGISTATEAGLADMTRLVDFIKQHQIKAIFVESSVPPAAIQRISRDASVKIGGELFSDAMGAPGEIVDGHDVGTFEGMIRYNIETIVNALK